MPVRFKRQLKKKRIKELDDWDKQGFISGHFFGKPFDDGKDSELIRDTWFTFREFLFDEQVKERPGTRPWAWWEFEAKEPRKQIKGDPEIRQSMDFGILDKNKLWFGVPCIGVPPDYQFETQFDYLKRLNLLLKGEESSLIKRRKQLEVEALKYAKEEWNKKETGKGICLHKTFDSWLERCRRERLGTYYWEHPNCRVTKHDAN